MTCKTQAGAFPRIREIKEERNLNGLCNTQFSRPILLFFSSKSNQDSIDLQEIIREYFETESTQCALGLVDTDLPATKDVQTIFNIHTVPAAILIDSNKRIIKKYDDLDPVSLYDSLEEEASKFQKGYETQKAKMFSKIDTLLKEHKVILFLKGSQAMPECGFSEQILAALDSQGIQYHTYNILAGDDGMRNWIKEYSGWPTIPQLFINGKIIGGVDKVRELIASGELIKMIPEVHLKKNAHQELEKIFSNDRLILFITTDFEGNEDLAYKCAQVARDLQLKALKFKTEDVKGRSQLEQSLTGLIGGELKLPVLVLDQKPVLFGDELVTKIQSSDLKDVFEDSLFRSDITTQIEGLISSHPIMVFIKGTPQDPQCGFTGKLINILDQLKLDYGHFNILEDNLVREKLKQYSNWKTYPQVYIKGELVGGLDVIKELIEEGELQKMTAGMVKKESN